MVKKANIGVVGMAVMGRNLALNIVNHGYTVGIYNRSEAKTRSLAETNTDKALVPSYTVKDFVESLESPRKIILMVKAGGPTDAVIEEIVPFLDQGDILIDGGNAYFHDTINRSRKLEAVGINFIGMGVSGGELGALNGPSLMPGGQKEAYNEVKEILEKISAKAEEDGKPCVAYISTDGSGHYVKMIHNGIEYGDMELIAETYNIMKNYLGMSNQEMAETFKEWNKGELNSYLIQITAEILTRKDDLGTGKDIVDLILDEAANKGTGKWSSQDALEIGAPQSVITESVYARYISSMKKERVTASKLLVGPEERLLGDEDKNAIIENLRKALYFSKIMSYAQGFEQMRMAAKEYNWQLHLGEIASIWRNGCIIRAAFLENITTAYDKNPELDNMLLDPYFRDIANKYQQSVRHIISTVLQFGIPMPGFMAALSYFDSYRSSQLPANLIQAQRDYFGAHTYHRIDREGTFHYPWYEEK